MFKPTIAPLELNDLRRWVEGELIRLDGAVASGREFVGFEIQYAEPSKLEIGLIYYADGVDWNPGAGEGLYEYTQLGFAKLGGGDGNVVPTSHSVLQDLLADDHPQYHDDTRGDIRYYTKAEIDALIKDTFLELQDTPSSYIGNVGKVVAVNNAENGLDFIVVDTGTGGDSNPDGGRADSIYTPPQKIDGGTA